MSRQIVLVCAGSAALALLLVAWNYQRHDLEDITLGPEARKGAPGQFVTLPDGIVHYELAGPDKGRVVVLVHGFSVPYYLWDPTFEALRRAGFRVLRYDLYGRGLSDRPAVNYDDDLYDRQLLELVQALHLPGKLDLAGASMGGPIAAAFACRHPELVRTVSLFDPGYSHGEALPSRLSLPGLGEYNMMVDVAPALPEDQMADFLHPEKFPDWINRYRPQMRYKGFRRALLSTLRYYAVSDWSKEYSCLGGRNLPVFLVWGKADRDVPFRLSSEVRSVIPKAQFLPIDDAAHVPFLEHPEIVNPALVRFLATH